MINPFEEVFYEMKFKGFNDCPWIFNLTEEEQEIDTTIEPATLEECIVAVGDAGGRILRHSVRETKRVVDEVVIYPWVNPNPEGWFHHLQDFYGGKIKLCTPTTHKQTKPSQRVIRQYLEKILRGMEVEPIHKYDQEKSKFIGWGCGRE